MGSESGRVVILASVGKMRCLCSVRISSMIITCASTATRPKAAREARVLKGTYSTDSLERAYGRRKKEYDVSCKIG